MLFQIVIKSRVIEGFRGSVNFLSTSSKSQQIATQNPVHLRPGGRQYGLNVP